MIKKFCPKALKCTVIQKKCIFCDKRALFLGKHSDKCTFYTLRFDCSFAAANTIKPQLL